MPDAFDVLTIVAMLAPVLYVIVPASFGFSSIIGTGGVVTWNVAPVFNDASLIPSMSLGLPIEKTSVPGPPVTLYVNVYVVLDALVRLDTVPRPVPNVIVVSSSVGQIVLLIVIVISLGGLPISTLVGEMDAIVVI